MKKLLYLLIVLLFIGYASQRFFGPSHSNASMTKENVLFDTIPPVLHLNKEDFNVLLYSKANAWVHIDAIKAAKAIFPQLAQKQRWKLTVSDSGSLFNPEQLALFDVIVWSNVTGQTLTTAQRKSFRDYIENGGGFVGIHGSGDSSQQWEWYQNELIRAQFSHHPMQPQFQEGTLQKTCTPSFQACEALPENWQWEDEWYVFYESPRKKGSTILYNLDETNLVMGIDQEGKNWGMGEDHPIVWYHDQEKGRVFYTAMGHKGDYYNDATYQNLLIQAVEWAGNKPLND